LSKPSFTEQIKNNAPLIGTIVTLDSPEIAEMLSQCGFDWLFFDMEHSTFSVSSVQHCIQAVRGDCLAIVRVPENAGVWIKRVLDTGCDGIVVPQVNSADEARRAVAAAKYPPLGARSVGIGRAHGYGMRFDDYVASANTRIALIIQIEHIDAVKNIDAILRVPGIDGVQIGPYDLSGSLQMLGQVTSTPVQTALRTIKQKCRAKNIPVSMFTLKTEAAQKEIADGCNFMLVGTDAAFLTSAATAALKTIKPESK
jgi:2-dehydro-3-deoxyglucarate aldolase/4-hydroxy-2-oxoheptanedioate aldolase